ncbi:MAG TPA: TRCF domain-containing protein, partial [Candidatus Krumholzibacteria bacterium]|nr:TRCF domain-containing protein [Candidatus Krumholzibacteria bacterium]
QVQALEDELKDRFGELPRPAQDLIDLARVKLEAQLLGILMVHMRDPNTARAGARAQGGREGRGVVLKRDLDLIPGEATLEFAPGRALTPQACARLSETFGRRILFKSGKNFAVTLRGQPPERVLNEVNNLLQIARFASKINALPRK